MCLDSNSFPSYRSQITFSTAGWLGHPRRDLNHLSINWMCLQVHLGNCYRETALPMCPWFHQSVPGESSHVLKSSRGDIRKLVGKNLSKGCLQGPSCGFLSSVRPLTPLSHYVTTYSLTAPSHYVTTYSRTAPSNLDLTSTTSVSVHWQWESR